jgi:hypothetical protein
MCVPSTLAVFVVLAMIGPIAYVVAREHTLSTGFERIKVGDSTAAVRAAMGDPRNTERSKGHLKAELEYQYWVWPLPMLWVVGISNGSVVDKAELQSR